MVSLRPHGCESLLLGQLALFVVETFDFLAVFEVHLPYSLQWLVSKELVINLFPP